MLSSIHLQLSTYTLSSIRLIYGSSSHPGSTINIHYHLLIDTSSSIIIILDHNYRYHTIAIIYMLPSIHLSSIVTI